MMELPRSDRKKLDTVLEMLAKDQSCIYIPKRVRRSDKLTFEQKELYGLLCMQANTSGVVANGTHLV